MKKRQLLASLLVCLLMVSMLFPTVSAYYYDDPAEVYVDDVRIRGIDAYWDRDDNVRVFSDEDLKKIFGDDLEEGIPIVYNPDEGIVVEEYADMLGYRCTYRGSNLYLTTYRNDFPSNRPSYPNEDNRLVTKAYVNGMRVYTSSLYEQNGSVYLSNYSDLQTLFPNANLSVFGYFTNSWSNTVLLSDFAKLLGYNYVYHNGRVYLNNDGNSPVEVIINDKLVDFPDQQPIVIWPGRTMVPVRTIAEGLGCNVKWNTEKKCAQITKFNSTMYIWPGATRYWMNGRYYDMDVSAFVTNGRTMVPLRFVGEVFGYTVDHYNDGVFTVTLDS